ncbi:SHOCT domain-containing protein [Allorhodopirellula solitaria]|uniref:SHOCT domain-containing protein n=1 Tax=Allorhodopirellula solitaria TaxID=2527987 RepID=UPI0011B49752|nr:SHOCT domain-containing protein [Allorhodopirellula solitaria]
MSTLSPAGQQLVQDLAQRHHVSPEAVTHMLIAVQNGNGSMAQFNHPEFGGSGQWMRGGMTMVSDLFNNQLKFRVDSLCSDITNALANHQTSPLFGSFQSQSQNGSNQQTQAAGGLGGSNSLFVPDPDQNWWPQDLGAPNAVGNQNNIRYAYFSNARRLAVSTNGDVWVYDTGNHQIGGFSQQQGVGGSITFSSQLGTVNLSELPVVTRNGTPVERDQQPATSPSVPERNPIPPVESHVEAPDAIPDGNSTSTATPADEHNILAMLEKLGGLHDKGYLTDEEFQAKKSDLLSRL